ncbi:MAG: hypothetical protein IJ106_10495 [Parasporobacterium sp.]|nr:hypothetical protein [Parasporobacterium sp.]
MIEIIVLNYLLDQDIDGIGENVFLEVPEDPPARYIVIEKTGSGRENRISNASFAVQSISANSLLEAASTNEAVKAAMDVFAENSDKIYSCRLDTDYNFTNTATKEYRYQAVFNLHF